MMGTTRRRAGVGMNGGDEEEDEDETTGKGSDAKKEKTGRPAKETGQKPTGQGYYPRREGECRRGWSFWLAFGLRPPG